MKDDTKILIKRKMTTPRHIKKKYSRQARLQNTGRKLNHC